MGNKTLVRLKDTENEYNMISCFYTEQPSEILKLYYFCKNNNIPIHYKPENKNEIIGTIEDIEVRFGDEDTFQCINIWINKW